MSRLVCPSRFPPPQQRPDLLVLAGEHSGDQQAARLIRGIKSSRPDFHVATWGGPELSDAGAELIYDLTQSAVVGLFEVLRNYRYFKELFQRVLEWVETHRPKAILLVDYPGFNLRLAEALHRRGISVKGGGTVPVFYYIAPQVWAWKKKRRFRMAEYLDALAVIFPFEVEVFADTSLPTAFVGHPFTAAGEENLVSYNPAGPILLLPGSRRQAVGRILPLLLAAYQAYRRSTDNPREAVILYPDEGLRSLVGEYLAQSTWSDIASHVGLQPHHQRISGAAVLTSSGTMSLRCALAGVPGRIVYRAHPLTWWIGRRLVSIQWLGMSNLLLQRPMYPEYLQNQADPTVLGDQIRAMLEDSKVVVQTNKDAAELNDLLRKPDQGGAAQWLLQQLDNSIRN